MTQQTIPGTAPTPDTLPADDLIAGFRARHPGPVLGGNERLLTNTQLSSREMDSFARTMHAFSHPESRESERFGLDTSGYPLEHQKRIARIVANASTHSSGMFGRMWHYVTTFFESLFKGDFSNFTQRVNEKSAMPAAIRANETLRQSGYSNIADEVSGVRKTEHGYVPLMRENHLKYPTQSPYLGVLDLEIERRDPQQMMKNDAADKGAIPSTAQVALMDDKNPNSPYNRIMNEIYSRPDVQQEIAAIRRSGSDIEAVTMADKYTDELIEKLTLDPTLRASGKFSFSDYPLELVHEHIFRDHFKRTAPFEDKIRQYMAQSQVDDSSYAPSPQTSTPVPPTIGLGTTAIQNER